jgi:hypothetical protein
MAAEWDTFGSQEVFNIREHGVIVRGIIGGDYSNLVQDSILVQDFDEDLAKFSSFMRSRNMMECDQA